MIRIAELKLPLSAVPYHPENHTESHPIERLTAQAAQLLGIAPEAIASVHVHKRSFDARKAELLAVYIVDVALHQAGQEADLLSLFDHNPHVIRTPDMA